MEKKYYKAPAEMPGGFWDVLQPLAGWILRVLKDAYESGYYAGKADAAVTWSHILDSKRTPPTGAAVVTM